MLMRALVTGACGFIGSVLTARLSELGATVAAVDDLSRGLNTVVGLPHVIWVEADCRHGIADLLREFRPQAIFHLAAATGDLARAYEDLVECNVSMTITIFNEMRAHAPGAVFVFPTTSLALGVPDSPYVQTKEEAVAWLQREDRHQSQALLFRFFNVIGAYRGFTERRRREVHIVPTLWRCLRDDRPFVIRGNDYPETPDGTPARDFIHVLDVCDYLIYRTTHFLRRRVRSQDPIPVGNGRMTTVRQLIDIVHSVLRSAAVDPELTPLARFADRTVRIEIGPRRAFDVGRLICTETHHLDDWRPRLSLYRAVRDELLALAQAECGDADADS